MTQEHPITPPPELVEQWRDQAPEGKGCQIREMWLATQAARWGADMELEACCGWLSTATYGDTLGVYSTKDVAVDLRAARRPKPPSLKEQALQELDLLTADATTHGLGFDASAIRRALESLPD
jgi:hypothetical protein